MKWDDGDCYDGMWSDNCKHGKGVYIKATGEKFRFDGTYNKDKKDGFGLMKWEDGDSYSGEWFDGKKHGQGTYIKA